MPKISELQDRALEWIERLAAGTMFENTDLYAYLEKHFPEKCRARGDAENEPRFKNDARWAVQKAKADRIVRDTSVVGRHQRVAGR